MTNDETIPEAAMVVISRQINQIVTVGDRVEVRVVSIRGRRATIRTESRLIAGRLTECIDRTVGANEEFEIEPGVKVAVLHIRGENVCLGLTAPKELPVHRKEVYEAIRSVR